MQHHTRGALAAVLAGAIAVLILAGAAGPARPAAADHPPAVTEMALFLPWAFGALSEGVTVTERVTGDCSVSSNRNPRPDAFRCQAERVGYDPCFRGVQGGEIMLACALTPWSTDVVLVTPSSEVPPPQGSDDFTERQPWALELADGSRCVLQGGTQPVFAGVRANYGCEGGMATSVLGVPDRSQPAWRVFVLRSDSPRSARQMTVAVAWW